MGLYSVTSTVDCWNGPIRLLKRRLTNHLGLLLAHVCRRVNDWLKAGIVLAKSVLVLSTLTHASTALHHEHMIDASQIMAVQRLARLFPNIHFVTEIRYRFNVKFLRFTPVENTIMRNQRELVSLL